MVRQAVRDGDDLIEFMTAVLKGDAKGLGVRTVPLGYRMKAAEWFADRGFGKTVPVVDLPVEVPTPSAYDVANAIADAMPPALREQIARELDAQFYAKIDAEVAKAEAEMWAKMPPPPIDIRDLQRNGER
jgi:N-acetylglutamate synthase-like GNAT family acetyltransferase